ncbi:hypothetical protein HDU99_009160, partial [Rhizoclosmatium hyalinum]
AVGPLGREADAELTSSLAAIYTYSHSKGLFAGISAELSEVNQRSFTNAEVYGVGTTGKQILSGEVPKPEFAHVLY